MNDQPLLAAMELRCAIDEGRTTRTLDVRAIGKTLLAVGILVECWPSARRRDERRRVALQLKILAQEAKQLRDDTHRNEYVGRVEQLLDRLI
jgi:hypothetical protein